MNIQEVTKDMKVIPTRKTKGGPQCKDMEAFCKETGGCCTTFFREHGYLLVGHVGSDRVKLKCPACGDSGTYIFGPSDFEPAVIGVGDIVKVKEDCLDVSARGKLGVVMVVSGSGSYGIDFGSGFSGHNCSGALETKTGWYLNREKVDLVTKTKAKKPEPAKPPYSPTKGERVKILKERDGEYVGEFGIVEDEYPGLSVTGVRTEAGKYAAATECEPAPQWRPKVGDKVVFIDADAVARGPLQYPPVGTVGEFVRDDGSECPAFRWPVLGEKFCNYKRLRAATTGDLVEVGDTVKIVKSLHGGGHAGETGEVTDKSAFGGTDPYGGRFRFTVFGMLYHEVEIELVSKKENAPVLKVGDRVRATQAYCGKDLTEKVGKIIAVEHTYVAVEYEENIDGHNGIGTSGLGRYGYCWNFPKEKLEIVKEETPMFKIGDRVTPIDTMSGKDLRGKLGTVVNILDSYIGVEFDAPMGGHNGRGKGKDGYCWEFYPNLLKKVEGKMRLALVTLDGSGKKYLFSVPADLKVEVGTHVICETRYNPRTPAVVAEAPVEVSVESLPFMMAGMGATLPLRSIVEIGKPRLKVGDWVKVIVEDGICCFPKGTVGKIVVADDSQMPYRVSAPCGMYWVREGDVEKTEAPKAEEMGLEKLRKALGREVIISVRGEKFDTRNL